MSVSPRNQIIAAPPTIPRRREAEVAETDNSNDDDQLPVPGEYRLEDPDQPTFTLHPTDPEPVQQTWLDDIDVIEHARSQKLLKINGERAAMPDDWEAAHEAVVKLVEDGGFPASRIFNLDETGLFYRQSPSTTLAHVGDNGARNKSQKLRITVVLIVHASGTGKRTVVIGKSAKPRGTNQEFWENNGVSYYNNKAFLPT